MIAQTHELRSDRLGCPVETGTSFENKQKSVRRPDPSPEASRPDLLPRFSSRAFRTASWIDLLAAYSRMVTDRVRDGWSCYLVTFMFDQLRGRPSAVMDQMKDQVQRVYSTLATRVRRRPRTASPDQLPVLLGFADRPVFKRDRSSSPAHRCNDGLHFHALVLLPPSSRLRGSLVDHFGERGRLYEGGGVRRIHVEPVTRDHGRVVDYVFKSVGRRGLSYDDAVLVLPRTRKELGPRWGCQSGLTQTAINGVA
jgi:hypothetical protein